KLMVARVICLRLFWLALRLAASRTFWTAGSSMPTRMAMIAITTRSSISVKPRHHFLNCRKRGIGGLLGTNENEANNIPHPIKDGADLASLFVTLFGTCNQSESMRVLSVDRSLQRLYQTGQGKNEKKMRKN